MSHDSPAPDRERPYPLRTIPGLHASRPGIQIGSQFSASASDEDLQFAQQLGIEWAMVGVDDPAGHSPAAYRALRERFAAYGMEIYRLADNRCHNMTAVTLGLPERDEQIARYVQYIRDLGAAGIRYATYAHMANGIWSSGRQGIRGGALSRAFRLNASPTGSWAGQQWRGNLTHGRAYTESEIWDNYVYFIRQVAPVAEEAGVYIGIHPDDPPVYPMGGVPRCIFGTFDGYRRAIELANSTHIGVCLCVGCWLEGGPAMGMDVLDTIRYFGGQGKLFKVHLRNVTAPMPEGFAETFLDEGYMDMLQVIRALDEVGFDGAVISDHLPQMVGGRRAAEAYAVGMIRAMIHAVQG